MKQSNVQRLVVLQKHGIDYLWPTCMETEHQCLNGYVTSINNNRNNYVPTVFRELCFWLAVIINHTKEEEKEFDDDDLATEKHPNASPLRKDKTKSITCHSQ